MCLLYNRRGRTSVQIETLWHVLRRHFFHLAFISWVSGKFSAIFYKKNYGYKDLFVLLSIFGSGLEGWNFAPSVRINCMLLFFIFIYGFVWFEGGGEVYWFFLFLKWALLLACYSWPPFRKQWEVYLPEGRKKMDKQAVSKDLEQSPRAFALRTIFT